VPTTADAAGISASSPMTSTTMPNERSPRLPMSQPSVTRSAGGPISRTSNNSEVARRLVMAAASVGMRARKWDDVVVPETTGRDSIRPAGSSAIGAASTPEDVGRVRIADFELFDAAAELVTQRTAFDHIDEIAIILIGPSVPTPAAHSSDWVDALAQLHQRRQPPGAAIELECSAPRGRSARC
jgi:hypothetical protein